MSMGARSRPPSKRRSPEDARAPAVIFVNGIGDHLLALPAMRALAQLFPNRLTLVCERGRPTLFSGICFRDALELNITTGPDLRSFDPGTVVSMLPGCDLLISLNTWHSALIQRVLERLSPDDSIGFDAAFHRAIPRNFAKHASELAFDVVRAIDPSLSLETFAHPPAMPSADVSAARRIRARIPRAYKILAIHADTAKPKMWPRERFHDFTTAFLERHPEYLALAIGASEHWELRGHGDRVIPCGGLPLNVSLALLAESDLFFGVDSCMLHAADLNRIPGIALFGPTEPDEFGFLFSPHRHVRKGRTMGAISVRAALDATEELLAASASASRRCPKKSIC